MAFTNNVTRLLEKKRIAYKVHLYDYDAGIHSATDVAHAIGLPEEQVFKTLVVVSDRAGSKPMLAVIAGPATLNLKQLARAVNLKKLKMSAHNQAEALTDLKTGGISPLALINKGFRIYLDDRAQAYDTVAISAGERGVNVEIGVNDLIKLTGARVVTVA